MPGSVVGYTVTVTDTGQTSYTGASVTDDLTRRAGRRRLQRRRGRDRRRGVATPAPVLTWTGSLSPGDSATITYSVTVNNPDTGDKLLINTVASVRRRVDLPAGHDQRPVPGHRRGADPGADDRQDRQQQPPRCRAQTVTLHDHGRPTPGRPPTPGRRVTDDADRGARRRRLQRRRVRDARGRCPTPAPILTWTGSLSPGDSATITYSVTVNNPDTGDETLTNTVTSPDRRQQLPGRQHRPRLHDHRPGRRF